MEIAETPGQGARARSLVELLSAGATVALELRSLAELAAVARLLAGAEAVSMPPRMLQIRARRILV